MNIYLNVEYSHLLRLEQQKLPSLTVLCTLYTLLTNSIGRYYYTHFTNMKLRFTKFEWLAQLTWLGIQTLIHLRSSARTELLTNESSPHFLAERLTSLDPWENFVFSPFVLMCLAMNNSDRHAKKTVSRSFIGSLWFWFTASCYLLFSSSKEPVGSGTHSFLPVALMLCDWN